jgi:hypothetical protein
VCLVAFGFVGNATIVVSGGLGIELDGLAVVGDGALEFAFFAIRDPTIGIGDGAIDGTFASILDDP